MKKIGFVLGAAALLLASCASSEKSSIQKLIREGKYDEAKALFSAQDANETDGDGNTGLHIAAMMDESDLVNFLILKGARTDIKNNNGDTPLHLAVKNNCVKSGATLTLFRANIFENDADGNSPLELSLSRGDDWYPIMINHQTDQLHDIHGQSIVHYFVKTRNDRAIDECVSQRLNLSVRDDSGKTPLMLAYESPKDVKSIKIAASLIQAGAEKAGGDFEYFEKAVSARNPVMRFEDGQTPLHIASILGHDGVVEYILSEKTSIPMEKALKAQDVLGSTPLHEAVRNGRGNIARKLLEAGADVNALDSMGNTPLLLLMPRESQGEIYRLLLSRGADPSRKDTFGDTVLHKATLNKCDTEILQILFDAGTPVNERNKNGATPLALAIESQAKDHIKFYATHGADIYAADKNGRTPLSRAMRSNSLEVLQTLITEENVNSKDSNGNSPLHFAITEGAPRSFIDYLLKIGADVNARNSSGDSILLVTAMNNRRDAGEILLSRGADIFASNTSNNSPLRVALTNADVQKWFITSETLRMRDGSGNTPLHHAAEWKYDDSVRMLLERGADIKAANANGETALFSAARGDSPSIVEMLSDRGIPVDSRLALARDNLGNTPLHTAVRWNSAKAARALIQAGVDVDAQNMDGRTALSDACKSGKMEAASLLIEKGANVNATDSLGRTVLMDAVQGQNVSMIRMLISRGANAHIQDMDGRSAYHDAAKIGRTDIIAEIRKAGGNPLARSANGETPLSIVLGRDEATIRAVLGGDTSIVDSDGNTPTHIAVERNAPRSVLTMLLDSGYPVSQRNGNGTTPLNIAVTRGYRELSQVLLERGADPFLSTNDGQNPITIAFTKRDAATLEAIAKYNKQNTDRQGDGILHYAARYADIETTRFLVSLGLNRAQKNISGETPEMMARRWGRGEIADILK